MMTRMSSTVVPKSRAAGRILRYARRRGGLTQRALAEKSGVPQETIARIESGAASPRFDTLAHLLAVCGFELEVEPRKGIGVDMSQIRTMLAMTPIERARFVSQSNRNLLQLMAHSRHITEDRQK
jgi:transcriptional regulator with XRE-family HTH domain